MSYGGLGSMRTGQIMNPFTSGYGNAGKPHPFKEIFPGCESGLLELLFRMLTNKLNAIVKDV